MNNKLKIVIATNVGKVLCISNNEETIKQSMVNYLIDTEQEPPEDFFESRNWGEYDIEVYEYHQLQKPAVPEFVVKWMGRTKKESYSLKDLFSPWNPPGIDDWVYANSETFIRAWLFGYEVEKEPLYMVLLLADKEDNKKILVERRGEYDIIWDYENEGDWHELLTEEQIKSVNPDYWKFAVRYEPSEEMVEE